jgi:peptidoglycan/xylan/chitin deacetylase (PgdA/CDA1 family)
MRRCPHPRSVSSREGLRRQSWRSLGSRGRSPRWAVMVAVGSIAVAACFGGPPLTFPPQEFSRGNVNRATATITFDCGASAVPTPTILDVLQREGIRTTFFLTGVWTDQNPDLA